MAAYAQSITRYSPGDHIGGRRPRWLPLRYNDFCSAASHPKSESPARASLLTVVTTCCQTPTLGSASSGADTTNPGSLRTAAPAISPLNCRRSPASTSSFATAKQSSQRLIRTDNNLPEAQSA